MQEQERLAGVGTRGEKPVSRHPAGVHIGHLDIAGDWMQAARGGKGGPLLL
jgi:hypothetical protein